MDTVTFAIKHFSKLAFFTLSVALVLVYSVVGSPRASALGSSNYLPQCSDTTLATWDWVGSTHGLKAGLGSGAGLSDFDYSTSSYLIFGISDASRQSSLTPATNETNEFYVITSDAANHTRLLVNGTTTDSKLYASDSASNVRTAFITSEPPTDNRYKGNWPGSYSANAFSTSSGATVTAASGTRFDLAAFSSGQGIYCQLAAHNVDYGSNWIYNNIQQIAPHGVGSGTQCKATDIGCWITNAVSGVQSAFARWFTDITTFVYNIFVPDPTTMAGIWTDFSNYMNTKLGFLLYPLTFFTNLFTSFGDAGTSCSATSCVVYSGNFMHGNFSIDFATIPHYFPTLWIAMQTIIVGITVYELLLAVKRRYIKVVRQ